MDQIQEGAASSPVKEDNNPIRQFFAGEKVTAKFKELLGSRAHQFLTSLLQIVNGNSRLQACHPVSIFNAAATAATMDLPINQNLGFAWIVPYKGQAQFQMGYKGFIQLAQRTGAYTRIVTAPIYENQFKSWNPITEDLHVDNAVEGSGKVVGYFAFFRLVNGYEKVVYWPLQKVIDHAKKYSKNFAGDNSLWTSDFDKMAMKTVLKNMLSQWGILSIEMQTALKVDQAVIKDEEGNNVEYPDNQETGEDRGRRAMSDTEKELDGLMKKGRAK